VVLFAGSGALLAWPVHDPIATEHRCTPERRDVDLVICLDTSGSMEGLLDSARARLWDVVNSMNGVRPTPRLRVGLLTYGSPHNSTASRGWVLKQSDLTSDLDTVYAKMMAMSTNGGEEYVGWVLNDAVNDMNWSTDPKALRLIFVAGNESADQGINYYNFRNVARVAKAKDILINAIYAGPREQGAAEQWPGVASCGGGSFSAIDMQCGTMQVETPHDKLLLELNLKLNSTYVPYGDAGSRGAANQAEQDGLAQKVGVASAASRVAAKATAMYDNAGWDLVDAVAQGRVEVKDLKKESLPAPMQALPVEEREAYVKKVQTQRADIRRQINETQAARSEHLAVARKKAAGGKVALDEAMEKTLREQAAAKGFEFDKKQP
jgi:hypothetical protein